MSDLSSYDSYIHTVSMAVDATAYTTLSTLFFVVHKFTKWHDTSNFLGLEIKPALNLLNSSVACIRPVTFLFLHYSFNQAVKLFLRENI